MQSWSRLDPTRHADAHCGNVKRRHSSCICTNFSTKWKGHMYNNWNCESWPLKMYPIPNNSLSKGSNELNEQFCVQGYFLSWERVFSEDWFHTPWNVSLYSTSQKSIQFSDLGEPNRIGKGWGMNNFEGWKFGARRGLKGTSIGKACFGVGVIRSIDAGEFARFVHSFSDPWERNRIDNHWSPYWFVAWRHPLQTDRLRVLCVLHDVHDQHARHQHRAVGMT
jgi:hypothetical protein